MNIDEIELKIKILDEKKTKAIISLNFGDFLVKGFRITDSRFENKNGEKLWLIPPSYQGGGRYHPIFYIPDKELWSVLEDKIWKEYQKAKDEHYKKQYGIRDEEWVSL